MQTPENQIETAPRFRSMLAATTLAASLAITGCLTSEAEAAPEAPVTSGESFDGSSTTTGDVRCAPLSRDYLNAARELLAHPRKFDAPIKHVPHKHTVESELMAKSLVAAKQFHLTIYNYRREYKDLFKDASHKSKKPVSTYMQRTNGFLQRYGATVTAPTVMPENKYAEPISPLNMNQLSPGEQRRARVALTGFIDNVGKLPVEFVRGIGLKHIYLVKIGSTAVAGFADQVSGDAFYIDPRKRVDSQVFSHELTHLWDGNLCGGPKGSFQDPGFDAWNPSNVYNQYPYDTSRKTNRQIYTDHESVAKSAAAKRLHHKIQRDYATHHPSRAKRHLRKYNALFSHVVAVRPYGFTNIAEDKATIGQLMFDPYDYQSIYNKSQPLLANKFATLLGRIYQSNARVAKYFVQVGNNKF